MHRLATLTLLGACSVVPSEDVATADLKPSMTASVDDVGILSVVVTFTTTPEEGTAITYVDLAEGDELTLTLDGAELGFSEVTVTNQGTGNEEYATYVSGGPWTGESASVTVALTRENGDSAPETVIEIPDAFDVDPLPATHLMGTDLTVTWSPTAEDPVDLRLKGDCVEHEAEDQDDVGSWTIAGRTLEVEQPCDATAYVTRHRQGALDPAFDPEGEAEGRQERDQGTTLVAGE